MFTSQCEMLPPVGIVPAYLFIILLRIYIAFVLVHIFLRPFVPTCYVGVLLPSILCLRSWVGQMKVGLSNIVIYCKHFDVRQLCGAVIILCFSFLSVMGIGYSIALILIIFRRYLTKEVLDFTSNIPYLVYPGNGRDTQVDRPMLSDVTNKSALLSSSLIRQKRHIEHSAPTVDCSPPPPPKKGRTNSSLDSHSCGPCTIWLQTGSNKDLEKYHHISDSARARHPNDMVSTFLTFLSMNGLYKFSLRSDSCMCNSCHRDCLRGGDGKPRWYKLANYSVIKHCMICCSDALSCSCDEICKWGPSSWWGNGDLAQWIDYLTLIGRINNTHVSSSDICKNHYKMVRKCITSRKCVLCSCSNSPSWIIGRDLNVREGEVPDSIAPHDWICSNCHKVVCTPARSFHESRFAEARASALTLILAKLDEHIGCLISEILDTYKHILHTSNITDYDLSKEVALFRRSVVLELKRRNFGFYSHLRNAYSMCYDTSAVQGKGIVFLYNTLIANQSCNCTEKLREMIKKQCNMFPKGQDFDFRSLFGDNSHELIDRYFNSELIDTLNKITTSDTELNSSTKQSNLYSHSKRLKLFMQCAVLANTMDPRNTFLQTLLGLVCYSYGLRDQGFKILNSFGVVSSIFHIRQHGRLWAKARSALKELDPLKFWRATFDNLDFRMKFKKTLSVGGDCCASLNRMFHLLTSQVSFTSEVNTYVSVPFKQPKIDHVSPTELNEIHFSIDHNNSQWNLFCKSILNCVSQHTSIECTPLLVSLRDCMPHWTPQKSDIVVYTTVEEGYSGSVDDVGKYLTRLKADLKIGQPGYPSYVVLGGDQQTYAHMSNLKTKYSGHFDWFFTVPGDWHIMKNTAEVLKYVMLDGGFRTFSRKCGHKGDSITQWKDIHNILVSLYEAMLKSAVLKYCEINELDLVCGIDEKFWTWLDGFNGNELSRFWVQMLIYLHAYSGFYFAIRSGNWLLRNSCLKVISELYFAYARDKYEVLCISALSHSYTYPIDILTFFVHGQWTVSIKGRPYHNLALDEAHECIINRKLKQITTRPSHFRMVELADFMAYLDCSITGLEEYVLKWHKSNDGKKKVNNVRSQILFSLLQKVDLFSNVDERLLENVFVESPIKLQSSYTADLLSIKVQGRERMHAYIRQYILTPPLEVRQKRKRQKLKTFTARASSNAKLRSEANQTQLLLSSAYRRLIKLGTGPIYEQTYPFPLALCTPDGTMRQGCKSSFREVMIKAFPEEAIFKTACPLLSASPPLLDLEVIVDFLFFLHQPPPPDIPSFMFLALYLWKKIVINIGMRRRVKTIKIIVDKPSYLPPPRQLLHTSRSSRTGVMPVDECIIDDNGKLPLCSSYQSMLANPILKSKLIEYIMSKFRTFALCEKLSNIEVVLDFEGIDCPVSISSGIEVHIPLLKNSHGEADYNLWFHAITSTSKNIIIIGSDTDIWVYGIGLKESGWLDNKTVYVERVMLADYVDITEMCNVICAHPCLSQIRCPVNNIVALYVLSGCDYVSSFFKTTKHAFFTAFINNCTYICGDDPLIDLTDQESMGLDGLIVKNINTDAWIRFVCCVYLLKHKTLFHSEQISLLHSSLYQDLSPEKERLLKCLAYTDIKPFVTITDWHNFTHRVCFHHSKGTKHHESLLIPSLGALKYHLLRALYVLKVMYSCTTTTCVPNLVHLEHGWKAVDQSLQLVWDSDAILTSFSQIQTCGCKSGCDGSKAGCKNCFRACKPCTLNCKCKLNCRNPHNEGGTCPKCAHNHRDTYNASVAISGYDTDTDTDEDRDGDDDLSTELPIIPSSFDSASNSDDSDVDQ